MKIIAVRFFVASSGNEPVREWLKSLSRDDRRTVGEDIKTVEIGWPIGMPLVRKMDAKLWEVRIHLSDARIARVLFTVAGADMVLLHGFIKKSDKTPANDLKLAKTRRDDVLREQKGGK
ncbi:MULTISPECIES: type II toxin-antitoxin system RelE/ParE family toxin [unclassified Endozoicomonas]|uniref:type II toxin-antitoxin system RelE/ParE family toxin n=1 Tax=unclassified Endozoicomonas TaxID=2644528 RepID=UPI0021473B4C|nr:MULTISPECIES: type II toxin-antitoxin system RelE/ParE family toxin [unclassified Endozoicomonas]